ncbi:HORMA domain-containing protein [Syncephalis plumigaleata]|nr:HORMA domain-containing protein [Syncephalis plumigaleata]
MQAQALRTEQAQVVPTQQTSCQLVKQLLLTGITCIAYLRSFFDESAYASEKYDGQSVKRLIRGKFPNVDSLLDWIELGCFEALDKHYLRSAVIGVYLDPTNPQLLAESYTFNIDYQDQVTLEGAKSNTSDIINQNIKQLIRRLILLTQTLRGEQSSITCTSAECTQQAIQSDTSTVWGRLSHELGRDSIRYELCWTTQPINPDALVEWQPNTQLPIGKSMDSIDFESSIADFRETQPIRINAGVVDLNPSIDGETEQQLVVECPCGIKQTERNMIYCELCHKWGHIHCYGYLGCTDPRLPKYHICYANKRTVRKLARNRRALGILWNEGWPGATEKFTQRIGVSLNTGQRIKKLLIEWGFLFSKNKSTTRIRDLQVNRVGMAEHYKRFFNPMSFNQLLTSGEFDGQMDLTPSSTSSSIISNGFSQEVYSMRTPSEIAANTSNDGTMDMANATAANQLATLDKRNDTSSYHQATSEANVASAPFKMSITLM